MAGNDRDDDSTDVELLRRLQARPTDEAAWQELVRTYSPKIYAWCRRWKLQDADARDVTQVVLARIAQRMNGFQYDPRRSFRAYLKSLAYYAGIDLFQDRKKVGSTGAEGLDYGLLASVEAREDLARHLDEAHEQHVLTIAMHRVRARVEPRSWQAFELLAIEGLTGVEVAERLGLSVPAAFKARSRVQRMIRDEIRELDV